MEPTFVLYFTNNKRGFIDISFARKDKEAPYFPLPDLPSDCRMMIPQIGYKN